MSAVQRTGPSNKRYDMLLGPGQGVVSTSKGQYAECLALPLHICFNATMAGCSTRDVAGLALPRDGCLAKANTAPAACLQRGRRWQQGWMQQKPVARLLPLQRNERGSRSAWRPRRRPKHPSRQPLPALALTMCSSRGVLHRLSGTCFHQPSAALVPLIIR
jgi:hypothetical protein